MFFRRGILLYLCRYALHRVPLNMSQNNGLAIRFWTEFDDIFHYNKPPDVLNAYRILFFDRFAGGINYDVIYNSWSDHRSTGDYPQGFRKTFEPLKEHIFYLADKQIGIIRNKFTSESF